MYYKLEQACITNWGSFVLLQTGASVVTKWGSYYKLEQLLLQNRAAITNWGKIQYKQGQVLQIRPIITNWGTTSSTFFQKDKVNSSQSMTAFNNGTVKKEYEKQKEIFRTVMVIIFIVFLMVYQISFKKVKSEKKRDYQ